MGSKSALLRGELGRIILQECAGASRFVDLFSGSGSVGHFVAERTNLPVLSVDLQNYSRYLAGCITEREQPIADSEGLSEWTSNVAKSILNDSWYESMEIDEASPTKNSVDQARKLSQTVPEKNFITRHYGGHYFSPRQAYVLDQLHATLPKGEAERDVCMAALLQTASICAAAPGHTAQPFQPTEKLVRYIGESWSKSVLEECQRIVIQLASRHAKVKGEALVADAIEVAMDLKSDDLVFCDPPYSAVQYSRFYHVLEGISIGGWSEVGGAGRSPDKESRESSDFSLKSQAKAAMTELLSELSGKGCRVIITFPDADASNGLSGREIGSIASDAWDVSERYVDSVHSTLGGSSGEGGRGGRRKIKEVVLILGPKDSDENLMKTEEPFVPTRQKVELTF